MGFSVRGAEGSVLTCHYSIVYFSLRNFLNSGNAHHDLGTMLIHMLMIVEMFVIVVITLHHCYDGHYPFSEMYLCP